MRCRKIRPTRQRDGPTWSLTVALIGSDPDQSMRGDFTILLEALETGAVGGPDCA